MMRLHLASNPSHPAALAVIFAFTLVLHGTQAGAEEEQRLLFAGEPSFKTVFETPALVEASAPAPVKRVRDLTLEPYLRIDQTLPLAMFGAAADWWTVENLLDQNLVKFREVNPFGPSIGKRGAMQFAWVAGQTFVVHTVDRRIGRKWGKRTLFFLTGMKLSIAGYQLWLGRDIVWFP